ncbi:MAG TPA: hypothetical protein VH475_18355, partial [Tepidisphaeraceae bacterium]
GVSDHRHKRMTVKALPGSSLEVIKTEFFFHLLAGVTSARTKAAPGPEGDRVRRRRERCVRISLG